MFYFDNEDSINERVHIYRNYYRELGWHWHDDDKNVYPAVLFVMSCEIGYNIMLWENDYSSFGWYADKSDAIEDAVDISRRLIARHEAYEVQSPEQ